MPHDSRRADRVAQAIREETAGFLAEGIKDPRVVGFVTVTGVDVTPDLRHARIYVSVMGSDNARTATLAGLSSAASHLRSRLARTLRLRVAPDVEFRLDASVERAARIESLLSQVRDEKRASDDGPAD